MSRQQSKQEKKIFSVTSSKGVAEEGWRKLLRPKTPLPAAEQGLPESSSDEPWVPRAAEEPIEPETAR